MYYSKYPYRTQRDYTTAARLILILYCCGWLPGFVFNLIKLLLAAFEKDSYDEVTGFGCLVWLLLVCGLGPIVLLGVAYVALLHL